MTGRRFRPPWQFEKRRNRAIGFRGATQRRKGTAHPVRSILRTIGVANGLARRRGFSGWSVGLGRPVGMAPVISHTSSRSGNGRLFDGRRHDSGLSILRHRFYLNVRFVSHAVQSSCSLSLFLVLV